MTGKTRHGLSIGVMSALTGTESIRYVDAAGAAGRSPAEPRSAYTAARVIQDFQDGASAVGAIFTATNRQLPDAGLDRLHSAAYVAGVDGRHRFAKRTYEVSGSVVGSYVRGPTQALERTQRAPGRYFQRPDALHLELDPERTSLSGTQAGVRLAKIGGGHWRGELSGTYVSPGFEINDLGFQNGVDRMSGFARVGYDQFEPMGPFRNWEANAVVASGWTSGRERSYTWLQLFGSGQFKNYWRLNFGVDRTLPALSPNALRGGPALRTAGYGRHR